MRIIFIILIFLFVQNSSAQTLIFFGEVLDSTSGEPLIGANIVVEETRQGTTTDKDGYFFINLTGNHQQKINIQYVGYETKNLFTGSTNSFVTIAMKPITYFTDSIEVNESGLFNEFSIAHQFIQPMAIKNTASIGDADIFRYLVTQSGVSFTNDISNQINIRGMRSDKLLIQLDDFILFNPYHLINIASVFDAGSIRTVELYKTLYPVNVSGRSGGMLKMHTKQGNLRKFEMGLDISLMSSILRLEGPIPKGSYFISLRRTYIDFFTKLFTKEFPYSFYDGIFNLTYRTGTKHKLEISGISSSDIFESYLKEDSRWADYGFGMNWNYYTFPNLYFQNNLSTSAYNSNFNSDSISTSNRLENIAYKGNLFYHLPFLNSTFNAGISVQNTKVGFASDDSMLMILDDQKRFIQTDFHLNLTSKISSRFQMEAGFSGSKVETFKKTYILPLFKMQYVCTEKLKIAAGYADKIQYISTINNERDYLPPFNIWRFMEKPFGPEISRQYDVSLEWLDKHYQFKSDIYYNYLSRIVDFNRRYLDSEDPLFLSNRGESYGVDITIQTRLSSFDMELNYSLSRTIYEIYFQTYYPSFHRLHKLDINLSGFTIKKWKFDVHWVITNGGSYTEMDGYYLLHQAQPEISPLLLAYEYYKGINSGQLPLYHRLDIHLQRILNEHLIVNVNIINAYNRKNILYYEFNDPQNNKVPVYMLPFLPSVGFEYKF